MFNKNTDTQELYKTWNNKEDFNQKDEEYKRRYKKSKDDAEQVAELVAKRKAEMDEQHLKETVGLGIGGDID